MEHRQHIGNRQYGKTKRPPGIANQVSEGKTSVVGFSMLTGFFAGVIWGCVRWLTHYMHFTRVEPGFLAEPFFRHSFIVSGAGQITGLLFFIAFSVLASLLYALTMKTLKGPYPGMIYGVVWWAILFVLAGPKLGMMSPVNRSTWDSIFTDFCLMLIWGLFIGYTISVEFTDDRVRDTDKPTSSK
ncbi:hypothetical protein D3C74_138200 [compost metagenome]